MARDNYALQKTKLQKEISRLQKKMQGLDSKQRTPKIAAIVKIMQDFDISVEEVSAALSKGRGVRGAGRVAVKRVSAIKGRTLGPAPIRYRHPISGATWSGRGRAPRWLADAEAAGQHRDQFLIQAPASTPATGYPASDTAA